MDAIVPPGNTSLVTSDHHGNGSNGSWHVSDQLTATANALHNNIDIAANHADSTAQRVGLAADATAQRLGLAGQNTTNVNGVDGRNITNQNGLEGRSVTNQNGSEGRAVTERNGAEGRAVTERFGFANLEEARREGHETREDVDRFGFHVASKVDFYGLKNFESSKDGFKDLLLQNCHSTDKIIANDNVNYRHVSEKLCSLELNQSKDTAAIQLEAAKNFAAIQLEASKNKCSIELDAAKHAAILAAQIAECCCEQKELTREKADETQRLILKLDEQRVRDQLRKTEGELEALRLRASLLPPLVPAVTI